MSNGNLNWIANFIWGIADDVLRDVYVRGKYRDAILPMTVIRRLDAVLIADMRRAYAIAERAVTALEARVFQARVLPAAAMRTAKALRPAQLDQIVAAGAQSFCIRPLSWPNRAP
jgi:type I restriction-modification system DNA methylase subunit